jgi:4-amino-4-deoxy-L-arabinose transferase-like glycosyltransferase
VALGVLRRGPLAATALFAIFAASTILWLKLHRAPPAWDDAWYLTKSLTAYDALRDHGVRAYLTKLDTAFGFKAPLIAALPTPFYLVFGRRWHAAFLVNIASMAVLFAALWRMASRWWSEHAALIAIAIASAMPLLYGLSRWYLADYALTAIVALAMALLAEESVVWFGVVCGLGLLLKSGFALYVLPAAIWYGRRMWRAAIPCAAIAAPWYFVHWRAVWANALDAGYGSTAAVQGLGPIFSPATVARYLANVAVDGVSVYFAVLAAVLVIWARKTPRLLLWWMAPFVIFVFGGNKDVRYIAPVLPALALIMAGALHAWPRIATALLAFPIVQMFAVSFHVPYRAADTAYAAAFDRHGWRHEEMVKLMAAGGPARVLLATDREGLNANNLELAAVALRAPLQIETTAHETNVATLRERVVASDFVVFRDGGEPESSYFNPHFAAVVDMVRYGSFAEVPFGRRLPDGSVARIFQRSLAPPQQEFAIDFGGVVELTGVAMEKTADGLVVRYGWRWKSSPAEPLWSFTHAIDAAGRIVAQSDRPLPLATAGQEIRLKCPNTDLRLRFGVYAPKSGERLRIGELPPRSFRFQAGEDRTALFAPIGSRR